MQNFNVPNREEVSSNNQIIFDNLQKTLGFVPNLYATIAYSDTALENYLQFQNARTSLSKKEKEVVNLVVSQENGCRYCQSAHTVIGKMNGFTEDQILEIRTGSAVFNPKLDALAKLTQAITATQGRPDSNTLNAFFEARRLLHYTDMPVKEIAYETGFEDIQAFSRFFKNKERVSPSEYRENSRLVVHS